MGAGASKVSKGSLYDLLEVSPSADKQELKQAYRRKALELHPDRNFQREEEVTAQFAKVQAAYDLLISEERTQYDQKLANAKFEYDGNFTPASVVREVTEKVLADDLDYALIDSLFAKLKQEEQESAFEQELDAPTSLATFGKSGDAWHKAKPFYDSWESFTTIKTFEWEDIYPADAPSKQARKKFEQENKKIREASKREFNAAVRRAVQLLKQRDNRTPRQKTQPKSRTAAVKDPKFLLDKPPALEKLSVEPKKGKAKAKLERKKQGHHHILTCGTCGVEMSGPELMEHKKITRHP